MRLKHKIIAATPLICLIIFLLLGFVGGLWHPGWIVFFLIPLVPIFLGVKKIKNVYSLVCVILYLIMGLAWGLWHPGWIIFLTIPVVAIFTSGSKVEIIDPEDDDEDDEDY
jgi:hypothetical protein